MRLRITALALAVLAIALHLAACGEKSEEGGEERQSFNLTLDFYPNPDHAGIYMAEKLGYFEEAGLDVTIDTPSDPAAPLKLVASGASDLAISYEPEVVLAHEQGLDVVAIGAVVSRALTSIAWLNSSGIKGVADLKGETIATAGIPYQDKFLETILSRGNLTPNDVKVVNVGFGLLPALLGGSAQAMLGGFWNIEGIDLEERGKPARVIPVDEIGVPVYDELVLVARRQSLEEDPDKFRLFLAALERGTEAAVKQPGAATKAITEANPDLDPKLTAAEVRATLPILGGEGATEDQPYGYMDPREWETFVGWMRDNGLIDSLPETSELLDNGYLPSGEIPE